MKKFLQTAALVIDIGQTGYYGQAIATTASASQTMCETSTFGFLNSG